MNKLKSLFNTFFSSELPTDLVLFNIITIMGFVGGLLALPFNYRYFPLVETLSIAVALVVDASCIFAANFKNSLRSATIVICFVVSIILFPVMYFTGGGIASGMTSWFAFGMLFIFMLLDGMDFFFMLLTDIAVILGCYIIGYYHPEYVVKMDNVQFIYVDIVQSLLITTLATGLIIKFQTALYSRLYSKAEINNDELLEKTLAAKRAERQAQSATEAKSNFLANMSHEIRTPINTIMGMDEMILRETSEKRVEEYAIDIKAASQTLLTLINDILDISKIESGKMEIVEGEYSFMSLMHDVLNNATVRAKEKDLKFDMNVASTIPCELIGDDVRIKQVLTNIITNAIKYTHEGGIVVTVDSIINLDNTVYLSFCVSDTGIGIKEEDINRLFQSFERLEVSRNRNIEGAGLGMAITQNLLHLMGSNLKVESTYGEGSTFSFVLTQGIADSEPIGDFSNRLTRMSTNYEYTTSFEAPNAHFLVVDDNAMNRKVFVALLKESKVKVTEASDGQEALRLIQNKHYDMIFLDHMMPGMDGIETFKAMYTLSDNKCIGSPVIALTANAVAGAKERYMALGFHGFLSKPIVPSQLEKTIRDFLPDALMEFHETSACDELRANRVHKIELPDIEGIDWEYALLHFPDTGMVFQTAVDFYNQIDYESEAILDLYAQLQTDDEPIEDYRIKVHAVKSMANTIGATGLGGIARTCEFAARDNLLDRIQILTPVLLEEMANIKDRLSVLMDDKIEKPEMEDMDELFAMLEMLKMAIYTNDSEAADNNMKAIYGYSYKRDIQEQIDKLENNIINMEYDDALSVIESLQQ